MYDTVAVADVVTEGEGEEVVEPVAVDEELGVADSDTEAVVDGDPVLDDVTEAVTDMVGVTEGVAEGASAVVGGSVARTAMAI